MNRKITKISENSNIEIGENSSEILIQCVCKYIECNDFRANNCQMKKFIFELDNHKLDWNQTWITPNKFLLHIVNKGKDTSGDILELFERLKGEDYCLDAEQKCSCTFYEEMKYVYAKIKELQVK